MTSSIETSKEVAEAMKGWRSVARSATRVRAGDRISVEVEGGFATKEAPCDGFIYESESASIFVPNVRRNTLEVPVSAAAELDDAGG